MKAGNLGASKYDVKVYTGNDTAPQGRVRTNKYCAIYNLPVIYIFQKGLSKLCQVVFPLFKNRIDLVDRVEIK